MNPVLFEIFVNQALVLDLFGVIGLGLVAFGAIRLAARFGSINARMMTWGALALMVIVIVGYFVMMLRLSEKEYREVIAEKFDGK